MLYMITSKISQPGRHQDLLQTLNGVVASLRLTVSIFFFGYPIFCPYGQQKSQNLSTIVLKSEIFLITVKHI